MKNLFFYFLMIFISTSSVLTAQNIPMLAKDINGNVIPVNAGGYAVVYYMGMPHNIRVIDPSGIQRPGKPTALMLQCPVRPADIIYNRDQRRFVKDGSAYNGGSNGDYAAVYVVEGTWEMGADGKQYQQYNLVSKKLMWHNHCLAQKEFSLISEYLVDQNGNAMNPNFPQVLGLTYNTDWEAIL